MTSSDTVQLSEEQLGSYHKNGFLLIKGIVPDDVIEEAWSLYVPWLNLIIEDWRKEGLLSGELTETKIGDRFYQAWKMAGRPMFRRRPFQHLINEQAYHFLRQPVFLSIAEQIIGTPEISMHGVYNGRTQPPGCEWATPPFHQDSHFWNNDVGIDDSDPNIHVVSMWFPLQAVDGDSGCLQLISQQDCGYDIIERQTDSYAVTSYVGMPPEEAEKYPHHIVPMTPGDILLFNQKTPHGVRPNNADWIRYSYDLRYEATEGASAVGAKYGFVAQSKVNPGSVTSVEEWTKKRDAYLEWFKQTGGQK